MGNPPSRRAGLRRALLFTTALAALGVAAPMPSGAQTPRPATPKGLNGDDGILMQADTVTYDVAGKIVTATGHVQISDETRTVLADRVAYDQTNDRVYASGHVSVMERDGNVAFANEVTLTDGLRSGALSGFGALIGQNGRMVAARAQHVSGQYTVAYNAAYTPCKICQTGTRKPLWQVKAYRVVHDEQAHRFRFKDATVSVYGVPVIYTPYLSAPDPTVHYASGLLTPDVGNSTKIGYFTRVPVYVALSQSSDITVAPLVSTKGGEVMQAEFRQRWNNGGMWLQGSVANNPSGLTITGRQIFSHVFGGGRVDLTDVWSAGYDVQLTSNNAYLRYYDISPLDRLASDLFIEGESGRSRFSLAGYYYQGLRATDNNARFPIPLPLLDYNYIPTHDVGGGQFRFHLNTAVLSRQTGRDDQRVTGEMRWSLPMILPAGQLLKLQADMRGDFYHIDRPSTGTDTTVTRGVPYLTAEWRWPFIRNFSRSSLVIEPVAQFVAQPYGGNPALLRSINEDSVAFEFDDNNLFGLNHLPGYDLVESGPRLNAGVHMQARIPVGTVDALIGQTYRLKADPVFAPDSGQSGTTSDVVGRLAVNVPFLTLSDRFAIDRSSGLFKRHEVALTGTWGRSSLQVSYVQLPREAVTLGLTAPREEVTAQADLNVFANWQVFAAIRRNLISNSMLDTEYGLGYEDECVGISAAYRRRYTSDLIQGLPPSTSVILRFTLKTGDSPIEPFSLFPQDVFANRT